MQKELEIKTFLCRRSSASPRSWRQFCGTVDFLFNCLNLSWGCL